MRFILGIVILLFANHSFAQNLTVTATPMTICDGGSSVLSVAGQALSSPTQVSSPALPMGDDSYSAVIPIGFSFDFYGNTFTQCLISSNGYITFDLTNAGGYSSWVVANIPQGMAGGTGPAVNAIMGPWTDTQPNVALPSGLIGTTEYQTIGTAPNRIFIVKFNQPLYGSACGGCTSWTIQLFESSNKIENHITDYTYCSGWGNGGVHGIQNGTGTIAHVVIDPTLGIPRQANTAWSAVNEAWEFVPDPANVNNYTINQIAYTPTASAANIVWTETLTGTQVGTGASITVSPTVNTDYTVTIQEDCSSGSISSGTVLVQVSDLTLTSTTIDVACNGDNNGSITITPSGTAPPWDFDWQDASGNSLQIDNNVNGAISFNGLDGGTYNVLVTDDLGCSKTEIVAIIEPPLLIPSINGVDLSCFGSNNGSIVANANGGTSATGNYNYSWTGPNGFSSNNPNIQNLEPGVYTVTILDDNNCSSNITYNVLEPPQLIITLDNYEDVTCFGFSDGSISTTISGGTGAYNINWTGPNGFTSTLDDIANISDGNYNLSVLDINNCSATLNVNIGQTGIVINTFVMSNYNNYNISCNGYNDGIIEVTTSGGVTPYLYTWSGPNSYSSNDEDILNLYSGTYNLSVTDANGCTTPDQIVLNEPDPLVVILQNHSDISCHYTSDGFIETSSWGSVSFNNSYNYSWNGPNFFYSNQADIYNLSDEGLYTLTVTDDNDCIGSVDYEMLKPDELEAVIYNLNDTITDNYPYINFYDHSLGDPVMWTWSFTDGSPETYSQDHLDHYFSSIGDYTVELKVENTNGCVDSTSKLIRVIEEHTLYIPNAFTPDLDGYNDVFTIYHHGLREDSWQFEVYDRFGSIIHSSNNPNEYWDGTNKFTGKEITTGVYSYYISYQDWDGWIYDHTNCENCSGTITLIR